MKLDKWPSVQRMWHITWKGVLVLTAFWCLGVCFPRAEKHTRIAPYEYPNQDIAQLWCAPLPYVFKYISVHCWFAVFETTTQQWTRWEVWQTAGLSKDSWGYVYKNFKRPENGVGGGPGYVHKEWRGQHARTLIQQLQHPTAYPFYNTYTVWPGPNSNTYIAWNLKVSKLSIDLPPRAVGKDYLGIVGADISTTRTGIHIDSPLLGIALGIQEGFELHLFCATFGIDIWPLALKTPFGRIGVSEPLRPPQEEKTP